VLRYQRFDKKKIATDLQRIEAGLRQYVTETPSLDTPKKDIEVILDAIAANRVDDLHLEQHADDPVLPGRVRIGCNTGAYGASMLQICRISSDGHRH